MAQGLAEKERLRPQRRQNYRVKFRDGYHCTEQGCPADQRLLVVKVGKGSGDEALTTRCERHIGKAAITAGQRVGTVWR